MLTVCIKNSGTESVYEVSEVLARSNNTDYEIDCLNVTLSDGEIRSLTRGEIFVMNSNGKTVAKYDFREAQSFSDTDSVIGAALKGRKQIGGGGV